jgi:hypothetical protein
MLILCNDALEIYQHIFLIHIIVDHNGTSIIV